MAGDIKQPHLIVPYAKMLASLATGKECAAKAYELLTDPRRIHSYVPTTLSTRLLNECLTPPHPPLFSSLYCLFAACSVFSWDSLFRGMSDYQKFFQASAQGLDRQGPRPSEMRPNEIAIMENLLEILRRVAWYSPLARKTLFENHSWKPTIHMFGLLCCPVWRLASSFLFFFSSFHFFFSLLFLFFLLTPLPLN